MHSEMHLEADGIIYITAKNLRTTGEYLAAHIATGFKRSVTQ